MSGCVTPPTSTATAEPSEKPTSPSTGACTHVQGASSTRALHCTHAFKPRIDSSLIMFCFDTTLVSRHVYSMGPRVSPLCVKRNHVYIIQLSRARMKSSANEVTGGMDQDPARIASSTRAAAAAQPLLSHSNLSLLSSSADADADADADAACFASAAYSAGVSP